jgi:hypothetical protein
MEEMIKRFSEMSQSELDDEYTSARFMAAEASRRIVLLKAELKKRSDVEHMSYLENQKEWVKAENKLSLQEKISEPMEADKGFRIGGELDRISLNGRARFENSSLAHICALNTLDDGPTNERLRDAILNAISKSKDGRLSATDIHFTLKGRVMASYKRMFDMIKSMLERGDLGLVYKGGIRHYEVKI